MTDPSLPESSGDEVGAPVPDRIVISSSDLSTPEVQQRVQAMADAQHVALVREVGPPTTQSSGTLRAVLTLTGAGAVGGLAAFLLLRLLLNGMDLFSDNAVMNNLTFTFCLALCIGLSVALADAATSRSWAKVGKVAAIAAPVAVGSALVVGLIAHLLYTAGTDWIWTNAEQAYYAGEITTDQEVFDYVSLRLHPIRGVAWLLVGVSAGITVGVASRSWKRLGLAVLGGAIGGFLGGFIFDFIPSGDSQESVDRAEFLAQLIGIMLLGTLIGLATSLVEQAGKSRWIEIVSGGLAGKQFILYKSTITLGSSPSSDITLIKDPAIAPVAAVLQPRGDRLEVKAVDVTRPVVVNGVPRDQVVLNDGDLVAVGTTQLRFREKNSRTSIPGPLGL